MLDGRVKTLHPMVHAGLLALRDNLDHQASLRGVRHRDDRPAGGQPLSLRGDGGGGRRLRRLHREHRHRRPGDAALGGEEPRFRHRASPTSRTMRRCLAELDRHDGATSLAFRRAQALTAFGRTAAYDAAVSGWLAGALARARAAAAQLRRHPGAAAALRREPAPGGGLLPRRQRPARRRDGAAAAGQGAQLQQHQRHRRGVRAGGGVRPGGRAGLRHHQARQSLRGGARGEPARRPTAPPTTATAPRPSAGSSR